MKTAEWYNQETGLTIKELRFQTDAGEVIIPIGFKTDLYTAVPNTQYEEFWLASVLHDFLLEMLKAGTPVKGFETRKKCDDAFYGEMIYQSTQIYLKIYPMTGKREAIKVLKQLVRISEMYYLGVTAYGWFWKWWYRKDKNTNE